MTLRKPEHFKSNEFRLWQSQANLCDVCKIQYDYIGKMDTFEKDYEHLSSESSISSKNREFLVKNDVLKSDMEFYRLGRVLFVKYFHLHKSIL